MSILERLYMPKPRRVKENPVGAVIAGWALGRPVWTDRRFEKLAEESYTRNAVAYRCVKLIATAAAATPWLLKDAKGKEIKEHDLLTLLSRPAPMVGGHALFEALYAYLLLSGNTYLVGPALAGSSKKPPKELYNLRPDRTKVIAGPFGMPQAYTYENQGLTRTFVCDPMTGDGEVLHLKEFHPLNDWYGLSPVEPAAYGVDRHNAASAHNKALLDNGARPSGALIFEPIKMPDGSMQSAPQAVIETAEKALQEQHGGPHRAGKSFVFGGNVKWEEMGISPKDMDFAKGKEDAARDICISFGVPHILIVPGQSTYNNVREAKLELWEDTILPMLDKATDALNAWLVPKFGEGLKLEPDLDSVSALEPRREAKRTSIVTLLDKGVIDDTEAREALQYGPRRPEAVKKPDAAVLTALVNGAASGEDAILPSLYRYLRAFGLTDPDQTEEQFVQVWGAGAISEDDVLASATPDGPAPATGG